jgi:dihydrofolate synthase/folylpolyglutamate synthase
MNYTNAIDYLYGLQKHGIKLGLKTPRRLLNLLGDPHKDFRSIHVAGSNGKGSTASAMASILRRAGYRVGLFTSPHLVSFTERITVDGVEISEDEVVALTGEIGKMAVDINPTFFEVVTIMGFLYFKRKRVDWAVVETGLGGRLDATNVISPDVSIITSLAMDHMEFLGDTPKDIAREKAGIIKEGVPVVTAKHASPQMEVIGSTAKERSSALYVYGKDFNSTIKARGPGWIQFDYGSPNVSVPAITLHLSGAYQALNASLAIKTFELVPESKDTEIIAKEALESLRWPGRLEQIADNPPVLVDGAHNPGAARKLAETIKADYLTGESGNLVLVMGVMSDKNVPGILEPLLPLARNIIFTAPAYGRAAAPEELKKCAQSMGYDSITVGSVNAALETARDLGNDGFVLITGSFYTIGEAKEALGEKGFLTKLREWQTRVQ